MKKAITGYRTILFISMIFLITQSCERIYLIGPAGLEVNIKSDSIVFAVIGDYGKAGIPEEEVATMVKSWDPDFILTTGDNNYQNGEWGTIQENISDYYGDYIYNFDAPEEYQCGGNAFAEEINRFFPSPGNHDANNSDGLIPYLNFFTLPQGEEYYSFEWGSVSFYSLNSCAANMDEQSTWLSEQLAISHTPFQIVYFHHSPYSPGPHGNDPKMQWDFFDQHVNLVLTGHDHIYSRISKLDEEGLYYIVNGIGGRSLYNSSVNPLPADQFDTFSYDSDYGAIRAVATASKLVVEFYAVSSPDDPIDSITIPAGRNSRINQQVN